MRQGRRALLAATLLAGVLTACGGGGDPPLGEVPRQRVRAAWAYTTLNETYVVRSEATWQATWERHQPRSTGDVRPQLDFTRAMVVGVTRGTGPSGCNGLTITKVIETAEDLRVEFVEKRPSGLVDCAMTLVPLTDFVTARTSDKPVHFVERPL